MSPKSTSTTATEDACGCGSGEVPIACSLGGVGMAGRLEDWQRLLAGVVRKEPLIGGQRMVFADGVPVGELAALAAAEHDCCPFFGFRLTIDRHGVALEVTAPAEAAPMVDLVFGATPVPRERVRRG